MAFYQACVPYMTVLCIKDDFFPQRFKIMFNLQASLASGCYMQGKHKYAQNGQDISSSHTNMEHNKIS